MTTSTKNVEANHLRRYQNYQYYAVRNQLIDGVWKEWREEIRDKNSERKEKDMRSGGGGKCGNGAPRSHHAGGFCFVAAVER
jgi:hypothetical protein